LNFGGIGGYSVIKLVKPIKTVGSGTPYYGGVDHFLPTKTEAHIRAGAARVLGKADAAVCWEVHRLDPTDRAFYEVTKLLTLFLRDGGAQVLNLDQTLADKDHLGDFRNACDP
jgi:hypothetical protein